jgi:signal transduction histidine kinase
MMQVLLNLVLNAVQAMPDGGTLRVATAYEGEPHVRLTVTDSGHGIPPNVLPKIFEPFVTTKERGQGTGLGLTVVLGIVQEHDGSITVNSTPGQGTTFTVFLPTVAPALPH